MAVNKFDQDETLNSKIDTKAFSKVGKYIKPQKKLFFEAALMMIIHSVFTLIAPFCLSLVIDICLPQKNTALLFAITGGLVLLYVCAMLAFKRRSYVSNLLAFKVISKIRSDLFSHMQKLPFSFFDTRPHGKILVRVVNYLNTIVGFFANGIIDTIINAVKMIIILVIMFVMDWKLTLVALAVLPVFLIGLIVIRKRHLGAWDKYSAKQSNLNAYIQENISGMKITQSFARELRNSEIFNDICKENKKYWMRTQYIESSIAPIINILITVSNLLIYIVGFIGIKKGVLSIGAVIAFASYLSAFWAPVSALSTVYNQLISCGTYLARVFNMMEEPVVISDIDGAVELPDIKGRVEFENVTFAYEKDEPNILENISFTVEEGETIAFVGPTGAGKSTIINLLSRFYDIQGGRILIDGYDIKNVTLKSLRSRMGIMLQDSFLFSGTIMDNIRYAKIDATDEEVINAAKAVCADEFISQMPDGYNTYINEGGSSLSAGQKQLIAFARALLADPAILILDEATSSIDVETELKLQQGLERLLEGRTSFIIAHRLSTIKNSSKIMYVSNKSIAECGTHEELIEKQGEYYKLYMAQYKFLEQI